MTPHDRHDEIEQKNLKAWSARAWHQVSNPYISECPDVCLRIRKTLERHRSPSLADEIPHHLTQEALPLTAMEFSITSALTISKRRIKDDCYSTGSRLFFRPRASTSDKRHGICLAGSL